MCATTYSARSRRGRGPAAGRRQFCSRLVAQAYATIGVLFIDNPDYCSPEHLRSSGLLESLGDVTVAVSGEEIARLKRHPSLVDEMWKAQDRLFQAARKMDRSIETIEDLVQHAIDHPERDDHIAGLFEASGYLDVWRRDCEINPWHYDLALMDSDPDQAEDIADYCRVTVADEHSGGRRYVQTLGTLRAAHIRAPRHTLGLLVALYTKLVELHEHRVALATIWLRQNRPDDPPPTSAASTPHSVEWFAQREAIDPRQAAYTALAIERAGSENVCSICGDDPASDHRLVNDGGQAGTVVRLCDDCVRIRRHMMDEIFVPVASPA